MLVERFLALREMELKCGTMVGPEHGLEVIFVVIIKISGIESCGPKDIGLQNVGR